MPELSYDMKRMPSSGRNRIREGRISLDSEKVIEVHDIDIWRNPERREGSEYGRLLGVYSSSDFSIYLSKFFPLRRLLGVYWPSDNDPNYNVGVLREIVLQHERKYESPEVPNNGKLNPYYKGLLVFPKNYDDDIVECNIGHFLDASAYSSLVAPEVAKIRVCTPNGDFIVDYQPQEGEEEREVAVLTHRNIGDLVTELTIQTATALMPHPQLKPQLEAIYNEIMGDNYSAPLRKAS